MRKYFLLVVPVLFLAAACNKNPESATQPTQQNQQISQKQSSTATSTFSGSSMEPTLKPDQVFYIDKNATNFQRGDIVLFNTPQLETFTKRIIGLPGEQIEIKNGAVFINQQKLDESAYLNSNIQTMGKTGSVTLKNDEFFVMGDNRSASVDSRLFGPIKQSWIFAKFIGITPTVENNQAPVEQNTNPAVKLQQELLSSFYDSFTNKCNFVSTADWKILTDVRNGFNITFKYPKCWEIFNPPSQSFDWSVYELVRNDYNSSPAKEGGILDEQLPYTPPYVYIYPGLGMEGQRLNDYVLQNEYAKVVSVTPTTISGYPATVIVANYDKGYCEQQLKNHTQPCQNGNNLILLEVNDLKPRQTVFAFKIEFDSNDKFDYLKLTNTIISTMTIAKNNNPDLHSHQ